MRGKKSYGLAFAFAALCITSVGGCDLSPIVADIIAGALGGDGGCIGNCAAGCGNCASCGDCSNCSACGACDDCGCAGCAVDCDPYLRDTSGRAQGFHGPGVHPNRRIGNAVQLRLTQPGYTFLNQFIPSLVSGLLGSGGVALPGSLAQNGQSPGKIYLELRQFALGAATGCSGNAQNGYGTGHDCLRATLNAYFRSCDNNGGCTAGENVSIFVNNVPVINSITCNLNLEAARGSFPNGLALRADVTTIPAAGAPAGRVDTSRLAILDAEVTNPNTLEGADVQVTCGGIRMNCTASLAVIIVGAIADGVSASCSTGWPWDDCDCSIDPGGLVANSINNLRGQLNAIVDAQLQQNAPKLCAVANQNLDCPTGTTYVAGTGGAAGSCHIGAANGPCMEILLGTEARIGAGGALAVVTPGIEATLDFLGSLQGHGQTVANGSNTSVYVGIEEWFAGIRALPHNPCVPVEHPANSQADCDAIGSGWEYEALNPSPVAGSTGRCAPRIPVVPLASAIRTNAPAAFYGASDPNYELGAAVSESFIQYAAWKVWDSGLTCLNVGTTLSPIMSPSLIALAMLTNSAAPRVFFPLNVLPETGGNPGNANAKTVSLTLRPQTAPQISIDDIDDTCEPGVDKVTSIDVALDDLEIDLQIWSDERYTRVGTIHTDLRAVLNLDLGDQAAGGTGCPAIAPGGLGIQLKTLEFNDAHWLPDAPLLGPDDFIPEDGVTLKIQGGLNTIGGIAGGIASGLIPALNLESTVNGALAGASATLGGPLPFHVNLQPDALQVVAQSAPCSGAPYDSGVRGAGSCDYNFLGVYVDLVAGAPMALTGNVDTTVQITGRTQPEDRSLYDLQRADFGQGELPTLEIAMSASGPEGVEYEYAYKTAYTGWSAWQRSPYAVIRDKALLIQGAQQVYARARIAGEPQSEDQSSATAPFVVDVSAPMIQVYAQPNGDAQLQALDLVSNSLEYRYQEPGEDFTAWRALNANGVQNLDIEDGSVIEVRDEEGNVGSSAGAIQGRPNSANSTACASCSTVGVQGPASPIAIVGGLMLLATVAMRRRRLV